ncbi:hypothetical protein AJ79_03915 [Helicocarpus griseus UAMH5409]|uniref:GRF-type domain-containing protein n=1 Tax=Helicocarpus griseus UAMH5409 TaxID=1447875 RepID=A0A2B7XWY2_9EURO|nr:hypothetical protein AJ79_03915 [Helicocarpus griseus UAMH5409]
MFPRHTPSTPTPTRTRNVPPSTPTTSTYLNTPLRTLFTPSRRGLFTDGVWHCNCDPRQPARHLQTRNGGRNQGRWFYTCPKPQGKQCDFFLWEDDAEVRMKEGGVVVREGGGGITTPFSATRNVYSGNESDRAGMISTSSRSLSQASIDQRTGLLTPISGRKRGRDEGGSSAGYGYEYGNESPSKKGRIGGGGDSGVVVKREEDADDEFGWDEDLEVGVVEQLASQGGEQEKDKGKESGVRQSQWREGYRTGARRKSPGWFRDGEGLFVSEDEEDAQRDLLGHDDPFIGRPASPSPIFPRQYRQHQPARDSPSTSRLSTPQTTRTTVPPSSQISTTSAATDSIDFAPPSTPTPIGFTSTSLPPYNNNLRNPSPLSTAPAAISTTTATTSLSPTLANTSTPTKSGTIVSQTLSLLSKHDIRMPPAAKRELVALLNTHHLRTQGILRRRDVTREALRSRETMIQRLRGRIEVLEAEREGLRLGRLRGRKWGRMRDEG